MPSRSAAASVGAVAAFALAATTSTQAFSPVMVPSAAVARASKQQQSCLWSSTDNEVESAFKPLDEGESATPKTDDSDDDMLKKAEMLGRGAAKVKRGRRKGNKTPGADKTQKAAAALKPEEVFYEGPPAITETIAPTISILTVVGIIPAAAAWARQAWVRYKITSRRIRVTSGINGKDMAEIVYPDIIEIRTAKRLFGDGDLVAFLRDGAKFEMRNIPNFEETMEFILKQVDKDVATTYRKKGDVTNP